MKHTAKRIFALCLALVLALSLAACSDSGDDGTEDSRLTPVVKSPKDDPAGYLAMAMENTLNEVKDRYAGSPLAAVAGVLESSGTVSVSGDVMTENGLLFQSAPYTAINDLSLAYDLEEKAFRMSFDMSSGGIKAAFGLCLSPDFVGVSYPFLTGDDYFYGIKPRDLASQLPDSYLWEALSEELNVRDLERIDAILDVLWEAKLLDVGGLVKDAQTLSMDFIKDLDVDYEQRTVELDGKDKSGWAFTATVDSEDLARMMEQVYDIILDLPVWDTLIDLQSIRAGSDSDVDRRDLLAQMLNESLDGALEAIREEDLSYTITYSVADGKVVSVTASERKTHTDITLNYFDGGDITGTFSGQRVADMDSMGEASVVPTELSFTSHVSTRNGYSHEFALTSDGEAMTLFTQWDGTDLSVDIHIPQAVSLSVACGLKVTENGFELKDLSCQNNGAAVELPFDLTLAYTGGEISAKPEGTVDILTMEDVELRDFLMDGIVGRVLEEVLGGERDVEASSVTP